MQIGMIGLGRMGDSMVRRLLIAGNTRVVHDRQQAAVERLRQAGAAGSASLQEMVARLARPRVIWLMVPVAAIDRLLAELAPLLDPGDTVVDGGNTNYRDYIRRAAELQTRGIHHVDAGTSGGVAGLDRGYCLIVGGEELQFEQLRRTPYHITVRQVPGAAGLVDLASLELDGTALPGPVIPPLDDGREPRVDIEWHGPAAAGGLK